MNYRDELRSYHTKFYRLALYQGLIRIIGISGGLFLVLTGAEMLFWMTPWVKGGLLALCLLWLAYLIFRFLWAPLRVLYLNGPGRSLKVSAREIGVHYPAIADKLINLLELEEQLQALAQADALHELAILQKAREVGQYPLSKALDFGRLRSDLKYSVPPLVLLLLTYFVVPGPFLASARRLSSPGTEFSRPAPFELIVQQPVMYQRGHSVQAHFLIRGKWIPQEVYVEDPGSDLLIPASHSGAGQFMAQWDPNNTRSFRIHAAGYIFGPFDLEYRPSPEIRSMRIIIQPPAYTRLSPDTFSGLTDLTAAFGSQIELSLQMAEVEEVRAGMEEWDWGSARVSHTNGTSSLPMGSARIQTRLMRSGTWFLAAHSTWNSGLDTIGSGRIQLIDDSYPAIQAEAVMDSSSFRKFWFPAIFTDDYGFTRARLYFKNQDDPSWDSVSLGAPTGSGLVWETYAELDLSQLLEQKKIEAGAMEWFLRVWDNDGVRGPKYTSTQIQKLYIPEDHQVRKELAQADRQLSKDLEQLLAQARDIRKETEALQKKLREQGRLDSREQDRLKNLQQRQDGLQEQLSEFQEKMTKKNLSEEKMGSRSQSILEKQRRIEELAREALDKETMAMMEELQKLLMEMNKDGINRELERQSMDAQTLEKELDRMLALLEQLKLEKSLDDLANRFQELKQKQDQTREELKGMMDPSGKLDPEQLKDLARKQEEVRQETKKAVEELNKLKEKNPNSVDQQAQKQKNLDQNLDRTRDQLQNAQPSDAQESMKDAAQEMEDMAQALRNQLGQLDAKAISLNLKSTRELLENLIRLSFDQEHMIRRLGQLRGVDPQYLELVRNQFDLLRSMQTVSDSLEALGKRVPQMSHELIRKSQMARSQMEQALKAMEQQAQAEALSRQQFALTSINDLAVLLSELMDMMQAQMKAAMKMSGSKPGSQMQGEGPKPDEGKLSQMQEQLNKSMKQALDGIKNGTLGGRPLSQEMARMAEQQEAIRQALEEEMKKEQSGSGLGQAREEMEKTEKELFHKKLDQKTLERQEEILTRLLESEKAQREKEWEERRESRRGENIDAAQERALKEYFKKIEQDPSGLRIKNSELNAYYNEIFNNYLRSIQLGEK